MPPKNHVTTQPSDPVAVEAYLKRAKHPLLDVTAALRQIILQADPAIGEEIKWNAPAFFFTGAMPPSDPKKYRRYLVIFNLFRKDCIRLVFWGGAQVKDRTGFLTGNYADGRRLAVIRDRTEAEAKRAVLQAILRRQLRLLKK